MIPERTKRTAQARSLAEKPDSNGNSHGIKVLLYHRLVKDKDLARSHWSFVHLRDFQRHLELIERWGFTTITLHDYRLFREGQLNLPRKPLIISFDDGYQEIYELAFPLLQEFGMKAVVFVLGERKIRTNYWDQPLGLPEAPLMGGEQIVELHESGFEIGSHSMTHAKLPFIREDEAWQEISNSRILLEILLNAPVLSFSYPYGLLNRKIRDMVVSSGFRMACAVQSGPAAFGNDFYEIRRITVLNTTGTLGLALRLLGPYEYYGWMRWKASLLKFGQYGNYQKTQVDNKMVGRRESSIEHVPDDTVKKVQ